MEELKAVTVKGFNLGALIRLGAIKTSDDTMIAVDSEGNATLVEMSSLKTVGEFMASEAANHDGDTVFLPFGVLSAAINANRIDDESVAELQIGQPFESKKNPGSKLVSIGPKTSTRSIKDLFTKKPAPAADAAATEY